MCYSIHELIDYVTFDLDLLPSDVESYFTVF